MFGRFTIFASAIVLSAVAANAADFGQYEPYPPQPYYKAVPVYPPVVVHPRTYYPPVMVQPEPYYQPRTIIVPAPQPFFHFGDPEPVYPPQSVPQQYSSQDLSHKCAMASDFIKHNNCGPKGCDEGLCVALQHGCHINGWGHVCRK